MIVLQEHSATRLTPKGALFCALDRCILEEDLSDEQILEWAQGYIALLRGQVTLTPLTEPIENDPDQVDMWARMDKAMRQQVEAGSLR